MAKRAFVPNEPLQALVPVSAPARVLMLFAAGQFGWSLASYGVGNLLVYFYMPPEQGQPIFPSYIFQGAVLGVFTLVGFLSAGGRVLDGLVDPFVAHWSDRKKAPLGKRRWFLLRAAVPFALFGALVFFPVSDAENAGNFVWLALIISLYYFFFALYVIPYNALMAELGHTPAERLKVSTYVSVAWALGFVTGNSIYALQGVLESKGYSSTAAFQAVMAGLQGLGMVTMLLPALFLNEKKYARQSDSEHTLMDSLRAVFKNGNFRWFLGAYLLYWLALTFIQLGVGFYTTLLLGLDKSQAFTFSLVSFAGSFILYWPINLLTGKWGKRPVILLGYGVFAGIFILTALAPGLPISKEMLLYGLALSAAGPLAIFGILPNAIVGDEAAQDSASSGRQLTGMYFGLTAFTMKVGISLANLLFPSLLLMGRSAEQPTGVQATALAAVAFCLAGAWAFSHYCTSSTR